LFKKILLIIFPEKCLRCKKKNDTLCLNCAEKISEPKYFQKTLTILPYKNPLVRKSIWLFKYSHRKSLSKTFAILIANNLQEDLFEKNIFGKKEWVIVPIPRTKKRLKKIGYNQNELLCKDLSKILKIPFSAKVLVKDRETIPQMSVKDRAERLKNVKDSFKCLGKFYIKDKNIILVDDVVTTGATLNEATRALKKSGAETVMTYVVAH